MNEDQERTHFFAETPRVPMLWASTETLQGIAEAARGEGRYIDPLELADDSWWERVREWLRGFRV